MSTKQLIFIFLIITTTSCNRKKKGDQIKPILNDITETVYASIKVKPSLVYFPQSIHSGTIEEVLVDEGDLVKKGQKLIQISIPTQAKNSLLNSKLSLQEAKANYEGANNLLFNIESEIQSAQEELTFDSITLSRQERLWTQDIGKKNDLERAKLSYKNSKNRLSILKKKKAQTKINLESIYKKTLNQNNTEYSQFSDYTIRSEVDGIVYSLNKEVGDFINPQERFAEIGSFDDYIIQMNIDEVDISKIETLDTVIISLEAYPSQTFIALVHKIFPKKEESTQTFKVESRFEPPLPKLYNGLSGEANILVDRRKNALVIPSDYLVSETEVLTSNGVVSVNLGIKNIEFVEVLSGIDTSTVLEKPSE